MGDTEKVIAIFKEMDFKPKISNFQDRLIAQKINCLLQFKGVSTGFGCSLYVRGPYSPALTEELYQRKQDFERLRTPAVLSARDRAAADELREIFDLTPSLLEIGATYAYFTERRGQNPLEALGNVKRMKSFYSEAKIAVGISKAKEYLFRPTAKDLEEQKNEFAPWEETGLATLGRD